MRPLTIVSCVLSFSATALYTAPTFGVMPILAYHNTSPSVPVGWYAFEGPPPVKVGEVVMLRDPPQFRLPGQRAVLMKRVVGVPGDVFCWWEASGRHTINGRPLPPPDPVALGMGIPVWKGCRAIRAGEFVGFGEGSSYDARYIGPQPQAQLYGRYRPA